MTRLLLAAILFASPVLARPAPPGSTDEAIMHDFRDWITHQNAPTGQYCCDLSDGRPLMADEVRVVNGHYEVIYTKKHWPDGTGQWLPVPKEAILPQLSPVGYPIAWIVDGRVICFAITGAA